MLFHLILRLKVFQFSIGNDDEGLPSRAIALLDDDGNALFFPWGINAVKFFILDHFLRKGMT